MRIPLTFIIFLLFRLLSAQNYSYIKYNFDTLKHSDNKIFIIDNIIYEGNKVTKDQTITRELTFSIGDSLPLKQLNKKIERSRLNLLNTSLFNFVDFTIIESISERIIIKINFAERWYTWPNIIFNYADRNFNSWLKSKDMTRVNYGLDLIKYNFRGRREVVKIKFIQGFNKEITLQYRDFFFDKAKKHAINATYSYFRQNEVSYNTFNNELLYHKSENQNVIESKKIEGTYSYRQHIHNRHFFTVTYLNTDIQDTISELNNNFLGTNITNLSTYSYQYLFISDYRDSRAYPLNGHIFTLKLKKICNDFLEGDIVNLVFLKSKIQKFIKLNNFMYFGSELTFKKSTKRQVPYFFQEGLGYNDYLRGYEYYVIDGQDYVINKNTLKFELLEPKIGHLHFMPIKKFSKFHYAFYLNLSFDSGYVKDRYNNFYNNLTNEYIYSGSIGLDFVSYYDTVLRFEYSVNKLKEGGFFIHFEAPL